MESVFYSAYPVERMRPPSKLMQSLFELCVVVGMDEDTGLVTSTRSRKGSNVSTETTDEVPLLLSKSFQPYILAVLSGQIASFPQTKQFVNADPYYKQEYVAFNSQGTLSPSKSQSCKLRFTKPVELPFGSDVVFSLPQFCLPDGALIYDTKQEETIHTLVLTDIEGTRSYCSCLTFYKPYYASEDSVNSGQFLLSFQKPEGLKLQQFFNCSRSFFQYCSLPSFNICFSLFKGHSEMCYVPMCCCLISKFPYFEIAKDCLSSFLPVLNQSGRKMRESLMQFVSRLCLVPVPPPGPINIEFELCGLKHLVRSSGEPKKRIIDMQYHLPFLCFSADNILLLLSCILTQQKIIFLASDYSLLTPITEALLSYIQPLLWSLTYVPVLPSNLIDLLEAPGSFIMGCNSDHSLQVFQLLSTQDEVSGVVIALIDNGEVLIGKNTIPLIPEPYRDEFKQKIKNITFHYDLVEVPSIAMFDINELRKKRQIFNQDCANNIFEVCLDLMLNLFSDFSHFIKGGDKGQQVLFDRIAFVDSKPERDREFFKQLCRSHAFSTYLCEKYEKDEVDFFSAVISENSTSVGHRKRSITTTVSLRSNRSSSSFPNGRPALFEHDEVFSLSPFVQEGLHTGLFYKNCIKDLDALIKASDLKSSSRKACYLYLRGIMYVANGQIYEGLDDFFALASKSVQMFPTNSIVDILTRFDVPAMEKLKNKSYFRKVDLLLRKHKKVGGSVRVRKQLIFDGVPRNAVEQHEFVERVMLCQITESAKTAERLFKVLNAGSGKQTIGPETFADFYQTLNQADHEVQTMDIQGLLVDKKEFVIKVSSLCKTDAGVGRLVLTDQRLLFMADGSSSCDQLVRLLDISNIENYQHYNVIPRGVPALRITRKDKNQKPFTACLKGERDIWGSYLKEMAVSHERAEALKDPQFISLGSQNVILADALIKSGVERRTSLMMCYFTNENEPVKDISGDTEKFLLQRLNPSEKDTTTTTVEALVYVPEDKENQEQIWCGMGSGSIVIFKPGIKNNTWSFENQISCANDRVSCLLAIGKSHVWAGSFDATIYVIDRTSYKADQHLEEHSDYISAMILQERDPSSIVWSASLNGQIIGWDAQSLTAVRKIKLDPPVRTFVSFLLVGKYFWCDIKSSIKIVDSEGTGDVKTTLEIKDEKNESLSVHCMISVTPKQVWCGCGKRGKIAIFDTETLKYSLISINSAESSVGLTKMALVVNEVWIGNRDGHIYGLEINHSEKIKNIKELKVKRTLKIHDDSVRSMCVIRGGFVATGPGSRDGKIAIWRKEEETDHDFGFETVQKSDCRSSRS